MKKAIFSMAALAVILASCDTSTKDSYQTLTFPESNLIVDNSDDSAVAQVSKSSYIVKNNFSKYCIDIKTSDLIINNQAYSFETEEMDLTPKSVTINVNGKDETYTNILFSKSGSTGIGSAASNLGGAFVWAYMPVGSDILSAEYSVTVGQRIDLHYTMSDRYSVQSFWPASLYRGTTTASDDNGSHTTNASDYLVQMDFEKKVATVYIYNSEFSSDKEDSIPSVICLQNVPITLSHSGITLQADAPATSIVEKKDGKNTLVPSTRFNATNFSFRFITEDLTVASIRYEIDGKEISFEGCSIIKEGY